jgi:hypothetical protein
MVRNLVIAMPVKTCNKENNVRKMIARRKYGRIRHLSLLNVQELTSFLVLFNYQSLLFVIFFQQD